MFLCNATLTLDFHNTLTGYGATINGQSGGTWVGGAFFTLSTTLHSVNSQSTFTVTALQKK